MRERLNKVSTLEREDKESLARNFSRITQVYLIWILMNQMPPFIGEGSGKITSKLVGVLNLKVGIKVSHMASVKMCDPCD